MSPSMPVALRLIFVFCLAIPASAVPYNASITADGTAVRSGPGLEFYPVLQLQTGDVVEVHYEQGDWVAIRPPIGSFSWVSAKYVDIAPSNVGTVMADGLAARIGSEHSDDSDTVQVTLHRGETVLILGRRATPENHASPNWLKIAPPRGEFRWLHRSALHPAIRQVRYDSDGFEIPLQLHQMQSEMSNDTMAVHIPQLPSPETTKIAAKDIPKGTQPQSVPVPKLASAQSLSAQSLSIPLGSPHSTLIDPFQRAFNELQREAYIVMTRPTDDEVFAVLIHRAEELHQIAPTEHDLEKTYHLLESLQRTRTVRRELAIRRALPAGIQPPGSATQNSLHSGLGTPNPVRHSPVHAQQSVVSAYSPTSAQSAVTPIRAGANVAGFDIVGRLGEFDPLPEGHPPYAVVDERERIICLISPSPHLDLSAFVGQFVGINGVLGYDQVLKARHITARTIRTVQ